MSKTTQTIIRTSVLALALMNQILSVTGKSPLPIEDAQIEALVSAGMTLAAAVWAWWKNNSVTAAARQADEYLEALKSGEAASGITSDEAEADGDVL